MPMMKSPFDQTLSTNTGHCIAFKANQPKWVPESCEEEARMRGLIITNPGPIEEQLDSILAESEGSEEVVAPEEESDNEDSWLESVKQAVMRVLTRRNDEDFDGSGNMKIAPVIDEMPDGVRKPSPQEVVQVYGELQENIDLAE